MTALTKYMLLKSVYCHPQPAILQWSKCPPLTLHWPATGPPRLNLEHPAKGPRSTPERAMWDAMKVGALEHHEPIAIENTSKPRLELC